MSALFIKIKRETFVIKWSLFFEKSALFRLISTLDIIFIRFENFAYLKYVELYK